MKNNIEFFLTKSIENNELNQAISEVLKSGQLTNGYYVKQLEKKAAELLGVNYCVAVANATSGLILSLKALGLEQHEIIVPSFTFFATGHAALWNNIQVVLADCNQDTFNIDCSSLSGIITGKSRAILAVNVFGNPCAMDKLSKIARDNSLFLIFDSAHAFGSEYQEKSICNYGDIHVFSLSPTKPFTSCEGGIIALNCEKTASRLRQLRDYGNDGSYDCPLLGLNARLSEVHALIGLYNIDNLNQGIKTRNRISELYKDGLKDEYQYQVVFAGNLSTYKDFAVIVPGSNKRGNRDSLYAHLAGQGIKTRKYFSPPLHRQKLYRKFSVGRELANTDYVSNNVLCLPIYEGLDNKDIEYIIDTINNFNL